MGEDCYSFIDDEFELPVVPKASTINAQKEHESASKTTEKAEKVTLFIVIVVKTNFNIITAHNFKCSID